MATKTKGEAFLRDLSKLTRKHGLRVGGCGCCGSPYIADVEPKEANGKYEFVELEHGYRDEIRWASNG